MCCEWSLVATVSLYIYANFAQHSFLFIFYLNLNCLVCMAQFKKEKKRKHCKLRKWSIGRWPSVTHCEVNNIPLKCNFSHTLNCTNSCRLCWIQFILPCSNYVIVLSFLLSLCALFSSFSFSLKLARSLH